MCVVYHFSLDISLPSLVKKMAQELEPELFNHSLYITTIVIALHLMIVFIVTD